MRVLYIPIVAALSLAGCGTIPDLNFGELNKVIETGQELEGKAYDGLAKTADKWCAVPEAVREHVREGINSRTTKAKIRIDC